jgi:hypothetical protein
MESFLKTKNNEEQMRLKLKNRRQVGTLMRRPRKLTSMNGSLMRVSNGEFSTTKFENSPEMEGKMMARTGSAPDILSNVVLLTDSQNPLMKCNSKFYLSIDKLWYM